MREMQEKLKELVGQNRYKFISEAETNELVTDQLWFNYTKGFLTLGELKEGDLIKFNARVKNYTLVNPSKIKLVANITERQLMPVDNNAAIVGYVMKKNQRFHKNNKLVAQWYINRYENWLKRLN